MIFDILESVIHLLDVKTLYMLGISNTVTRRYIDKILDDMTHVLVTTSNTYCAFANNGRTYLIQRQHMYHPNKLRAFLLRFPPKIVVLDVDVDHDLCVQLMRAIHDCGHNPTFVINDQVKDKLVEVLPITYKNKSHLTRTRGSSCVTKLCTDTIVLALYPCILQPMIENAILSAFNCGYRYIEVWITWDIDIEAFNFIRMSDQMDPLVFNACGVGKCLNNMDTFMIVYSSLTKFNHIYPDCVTLLSKDFKYITLSNFL